MRYMFNVSMNDEDYLDYNMFWMTRSPYGKKQVLTFRLIFVLMTMVPFLLSFVGGFTLQTLIDNIPLLILLVVTQLLLVPFYRWVLKLQFKSLKKKGKMGYSPTAVMEFYEDTFVETTQDNRNERKYSAVERISVVDNKTIYLHVNNVMAYILPFECFVSAEQRNEFLDFIKVKCGSVDIYQ